MSYAIIKCKEKSFLEFVDVENTLNELIIALPKFKEKKTKKIAQKVCKVLKKNKISNAVLENDLLQNEEFKNLLYENNNYIITGKRLYKSLLMLCIKDISKMMKVNTEQLTISILLDEYSIENVNLIEYISNNVKNVNVITSNYNRFEKLSEYLINKNGTAIRIINRERVNIGKSQFIINIDLSENEIKKIKMPRESIIFSTYEKISSLKKNFNGIIINDIDISLNNNTKNIRTLSLCEAYIYNYLKRIEDNERIFEKSDYKINGYFGNNGKITEEDFTRIAKANFSQSYPKNVKNKA